MKKIVQRMCMGCNNKKDKRELIRVVMDKTGKISIDLTGKLQGRGAYICNNIECFDKIVKSKRLNKMFEKDIDDEIYNELRGVIIDKDV